jgi:hypothetical protein
VNGGHATESLPLWADVFARLSVIALTVLALRDPQFFFLIGVVGFDLFAMHLIIPEPRGKTLTALSRWVLHDFGAVLLCIGTVSQIVSLLAQPWP